MGPGCELKDSGLPVASGEVDMSRQTADYNADIIQWARQQAALLRAGRFSALDIEHIAEEIEDVGKSEERELESRLAVLIAHLLKWQYQPEKRGPSWQFTIAEQRRMIHRRLKKTPSLNRALNDADWISDAWTDGCMLAAKETGIARAEFPRSCVWRIGDMLGDEFWPDSVNE